MIKCSLIVIKYYAAHGFGSAANLWFRTSEKGEVLLRGVGTLRYVLILGEISACQVHICAVAACWFDNPHQAVPTPGVHNKIPAHKIFARVWVAQEPICYTINAKIFQGLGPKRRKSCDGDRV